MRLNARLAVGSSSKKFCLLVAALLPGAAFPGATARGQVRTVALSGQAAPDTPNGVIYDNFSFGYSTPALNAAGQIAFSAALSGSGVDSTNYTGIWSEGSGSLALVARGGDQALGTPSGVKYSAFVFGRSVLNVAGQTAFYTTLTGSGVNSSNDSGIWSEGSGSLTLVAREGNPAPGTSSGVNYIALNNPVLNAAGQTAFRATLTGSGVNSLNNRGIWSEGSGSLVLVARAGDQAPGTPGGVKYNSVGFSDPVLNAAGQTAFYAELIGSGVDDTNYTGIWSEGSGSLALVARAGDQAPGTSSGVNYDSFFDVAPALNAAGHTAFLAYLTGSGVNSSNDSGIWSEGSGTLALVARAGNPAPGTSSGVNYAALSNPVLNATGQTAFYGRLTGSGVNSSNDGGIWSESSGTLALVAREGSPAPGTPSGVNFSDLHSPVLNAAGQTAFYGFLAGSGVHSANDQGIWATDSSGALQLIARKGNQLEIAPAVFRTVASLYFVGYSGNEDGRPSGFNDLGQVAFAADFTDDSSGVFVSDLVAESGGQDGDFDLDGDVDGADFLRWQRGQSPGGLSATGLTAWKNHFGTSAAPNQSPVPEPASLLLTILAAAAIRPLKRRRSQGSRSSRRKLPT